MKARDESFQMEVGAEFPLYTIDSLFYEKGRKLAFAHLDVEGLELDVLKGAVQTMRQSRPIFTTEVRVHKDVAYTDALMDFIFDLGYDSYVINEVWRSVVLPYPINGQLLVLFCHGGNIPFKGA